MTTFKKLPTIAPRIAKKTYGTHIIPLFYIAPPNPRAALGLGGAILETMTTRTITFSSDAQYHVYNRGNGKRAIFLNPSDYARFITLLYIANTSHQYNIRDLLKAHADIFDVKRPDQLVEIHAVCLMKNHYHLLVTPLSDDGLSRFMLKLGTGYSMYFNTKYDRTGSLFEGRFKARHADDDRYLKYLFSYIHLNPVRSHASEETFVPARNTFARAKTYPYSSLSIYTNSSPRAALGLGMEKVIKTDLFKMYFPTEKVLERELYDWITYEQP